MDQRSGGNRTVHQRARCGHGLPEQDGGLRPAPPLRWRQVFRPRARTLRAWDPRVREYQDGLDPVRQLYGIVVVPLYRYESSTWAIEGRNGKRNSRFPGRQAGIPNGKDLPPVRADCAAGGRLDPQGPTQAWGPVAGGTRPCPAIWGKPHRRARSGEDLAG